MVKPSSSEKIRSLVKSYPNEFQSSGGKLWCSLCNRYVSHDRKYQVDSHRRSAKHQRRLRNISSSTATTSTSKEPVTQENFCRKITEAFLAADIPLKKLQNNKIKELFDGLGFPVPSESACRSKVKEIATDVKKKVRKVIEDDSSGVFVVFDESSIRDVSYACVLIGTLDKPQITHLAHTEVLDCPLSAQKVCNIIDDVLRMYRLPKSKLYLLISDAARYMVKAGKNLKFFYENMSHVLCVSHLLHNAALKVKTHFPKVDKVIATVKAATSKNKTRKAMFLNAGLKLPPQPIVTRWGSWLKAAIYYAENLNSVKYIFFGMNGGLLVQRAQKALRYPKLNEDLTKLVQNYSNIVKITEEETGTQLTIDKAKTLLSTSKLREEECNISKYIEKRVTENKITKIFNQSDESINPAVYAKLLRCQATSVSVERLFSILNKLLAKDRNFKPENINDYLICKYNANLI